MQASKRCSPSGESLPTKGGTAGQGNTTARELNKCTRSATLTVAKLQRRLGAVWLSEEFASKEEDTKAKKRAQTEMQQ